MLKEAKEQCDYLIVGLHTDPSTDRVAKNKPIQSLNERRIQLESNKYVDEVIVYETEAELYDVLDNLDFDVRIIGEDWRGKEFTGHTLPIPVYYNSRSHNYSSTDLRNRIYQAEKAKHEN